MTSATSATSTRLGDHRLVLGLFTGVVAELILFSALAIAAWGSSMDEDLPPLSANDGLVVLAIFGSIPTAFVIAAAACIVATRRMWGTVVASLLMLGAAVVGFLGFALISFSRQEISDC